MNFTPMMFKYSHFVIDNIKTCSSYCISNFKILQLVNIVINITLIHFGRADKNLKSRFEHTLTWKPYIKELSIPRSQIKNCIICHVKIGCTEI